MEERPNRHFASSLFLAVPNITVNGAAEDRNLIRYSVGEANMSLDRLFEGDK